MTTTVFVSGASGFIAQHIVKLLIEKGYNVVGTVRSAAKGDSLAASLNTPAFTYEIVPEISVDDSFDAAIKAHPEVTILLHTASPFFYDSTDPETDLVIPAIKGTTNILNAVKKFASQITRIVVTSSDAAIYSSEDERNSALSFDETSWNNISYEEAIKGPIPAYYGAKSFAEKLSWKFFEENPDVKAKLSVVNPVYVFGPQAFDSEVKPVLNTSNELVHTLIKLGPNDAFELDIGGAVDVRDVAKAHLAAFEEENTIGKRLFMTNGQFSTQMMLDYINKNFESLRGRIPVGEPGTGPEHIKTLGKTSNVKTKEILGFEFIPLEKTVVDIVSQILAKQNKL